MPRVYAIDDDGDLEVSCACGAKDGEYFYIPKSDWPKVRRLIAPAGPAVVNSVDPAWRYEVKPGDDAYLYHRSSTTYVFMLSCTPDEAQARELAQWFVTHQPAISEDDQQYLTGHVPGAFSHQCVTKLTEIRAAIEAGTYLAAELASTPTIWQIVDTRLNCIGYGTAYDWTFFGEPARSKAMDLAVWLENNQPPLSAEDIAAVRSFGHVSCYRHLRRHLQTPADPKPAYRWYIKDNDDLHYEPSMGDDYVMDFDLAQHEGFSRIDARNLAEWFVQHQPAITEDERVALTDQDRTDGGHESPRSAHMLKAIKARIEAAEVAPDASAPASAAAQYDATCEAIGDTVPFTKSGGSLYYKNLFVFGCRGDERRDLADWAVATQPALQADQVEYITSEDNDQTSAVAELKEIRRRIGAAAPLPFTPDRAEVSDDPAFWQQVADQGEAPAMVAFEDLDHMINDGSANQPRRLRVSFTFDPSDISVASRVYAALGQLPIDIKAAIEIR